MLFYHSDLSDEGILTLSEEESFHAGRALRLQPGDRFSVTDGRGSTAEADIIAVGKRSLNFKITNKFFIEPTPYHIHIAIAPTKNIDRMEWMVEKCVEIGVHVISFIITARTERSKANIDRLQKIALAAMKQAKRAWLPTLHDMSPFSSILSCAAAGKWIAQGYSSSPLWRQASPNQSYLVLIGPEGDFTTEEMEIALQRNFSLAGLGNYRLRTETAGIVACQSLQMIQQTG